MTALPFPRDRWRPLADRVAAKLDTETHPDALRLVVGFERLCAPWLDGQGVGAALVATAAASFAVDLAPTLDELEQRRQVAVHEAAHAVYLLSHGVAIERVTVRARPSALDARGFVEMVRPNYGPATTARARERVQLRAIAELIACEAERLAEFHFEEGIQWRHNEDAAKWLLHLRPALNQAEVLTLRDHLRQRAASEARRLWTMIECMSRELLKAGTLTGAQVSALLEPAESAA